MHIRMSFDVKQTHAYTISSGCLNIKQINPAESCTSTKSGRKAPLSGLEFPPLRGGFLLGTSICCSKIHNFHRRSEPFRCNWVLHFSAFTTCSIVSATIFTGFDRFTVSFMPICQSLGSRHGGELILTPKMGGADGLPERLLLQSL